MYHYIKQFSQHNLQLNIAAVQSEGLSRGGGLVWPVIAIISDSVVMVKKLESDGSRYILLYALPFFSPS